MKSKSPISDIEKKFFLFAIFLAGGFAFLKLLLVAFDEFYQVTLIYALNEVYKADGIDLGYRIYWCGTGLISFTALDLILCIGLPTLAVLIVRKLNLTRVSISVFLLILTSYSYLFSITGIVEGIFPSNILTSYLYKISGFSTYQNYLGFYPIWFIFFLLFWHVTIIGRIVLRSVESKHSLP